MRVRLYQLDGRVNLALMRISAHHKARGDDVEWVKAATADKVRKAVEARAGEATFSEPDKVYASLIFTKTRPLAERLLEFHPSAVIGGTGWDFGKTEGRTTLESVGVDPKTPPDYSAYPSVTYSLGYTHRGCRLRCDFCDVWRSEPRIESVASTPDIWRGDPWPRHLLLLDNDVFGNPDWEKRFEEMRSGMFSVCLQQGFNARMLGREHAEAIARLDYRAEDFATRRLYVAWDNRDDEGPLMRGLERLAAAGVTPRDILVYVLTGFEHPKAKGEHGRARPLHEDDIYRVRQLLAFGALPYPMPFTRTTELIGFQRWAVQGYAKTGISWEDFVRADYRPERLGLRDPEMPLFS